MDKTAYLNKLRGVVQAHGHAVQSVMDPEKPFAYTAGLSQRQAPEFVIRMPIPPEVQMMILNLVVERFMQDPSILNGRDIHQILTGVPVRLLPLPNEVIRDNLLMAQHLAADHDVTVESMKAYQVMCPDKNGLFPGEPGCSQAIANMQTWDRDPSDEESTSDSHQTLH